MRKVGLRALIALVVSCSAAAVATAGLITQVETTASNGFPFFITTDSPGPERGSGPLQQTAFVPVSDEPAMRSFASAGADGGILSVRAEVQLGGGRLGSAAANSFFAIDDLLISPTVSQTTGERIQTQLGFHLSGANLLNADGDASVFLRTQIEMSVFQPNGAGTTLNGVATDVLRKPDSAEFSREGVEVSTATRLDQISGEFFLTEPFDIVVGKPFGLQLAIQTGGEVQSGIDSAGGLRSLFDQTLSFPTSGPVFVLPSGYTANSLQGNIVNNRFGTPAQTTPIPEPSSLALLGIGAAGLFGYGRRRKRREPVSSDGR